MLFYEKRYNVTHEICFVGLIKWIELMLTVYPIISEFINVEWLWLLSNNGPQILSYRQQQACLGYWIPWRFQLKKTVLILGIAWIFFCKKLEARLLVQSILVKKKCPKPHLFCVSKKFNSIQYESIQNFTVSGILNKAYFLVLQLTWWNGIIREWYFTPRPWLLPSRALAVQPSHEFSFVRS